MKPFRLCFLLVGLSAIAASAQDTDPARARNYGKYGPAPQPAPAPSLASRLIVSNGRLVWIERDGQPGVGERAYPVRVVNGTNVPVWMKWAAQDGLIKDPLPRWEYVLGKVVQASAGDGMLVSLGIRDASQIVFVKECPQKYIDGQMFAETLLPDGIHEYNSVNGSRETVVAYRFGLLPKPIPPATPEQLQRIAEEKAAKAKAKQEALDAAVAKFKAEQAAKAAAEK